MFFILFLFFYFFEQYIFNKKEYYE
jgi:hypothetical protein